MNHAVIYSALIILGIYIPLKIPVSESLFIPNAFAGLLCLYSFRRVDSADLRKIAWCLVCLLLLLIFNLSLSQYDYTSFGEKLRSCMLLWYNFTIAMVVIFARTNNTRQQEDMIGYIMLAMSLLILFCAVLEVRVDAFRAISDNFRDVVYPVDLLYGSDARDMELAGKIRPKVFTSEPSHVAFAGSAFAILGGIFCSRKSLKGLSFFILIGLGFAISSPWPFGFAVLSAFSFLTPALTPNFRPLLTLAVGAIVAPICVFLIYTVSEPIRNRVDLLLDGKDYSTIIRTVYQANIAVEGLKVNPVVGVGFGGEDEIAGYLYSLPGVTQRIGNRIIQSPFFSIILFSGIMGLLFWLAWLGWLVSKLDHRVRVGVFTFVLFLFQQGGSASSTIDWLFCGIIINKFLYLRSPPVTDGEPFFQKFKRNA